jgi:hypothetical protein
VWLQWNAATECNMMLPLAAFPMHYSCRPVQSFLAINFEAISIAKSSGPRRHGDSGRSNRQ